MPRGLEAAEEDKRIVFIDFGSFVLPFTSALIAEIIRDSKDVHYVGSTTQHNASFLDEIRCMLGNKVTLRPLSKSMGHSVLIRFLGLLRLLLQVVWLAKSNCIFIVQFQKLIGLEFVLLKCLPGKTVYLLHNAVPHTHGSDKHWPTQLGCLLSDVVVVPSTFTKREVMRRYSRFLRTEPKQIRHPLVGPFPIVTPSAPFDLHFDAWKIKFFGSVKPYKGASVMWEMMKINREEAKGISLQIFGKWDVVIYGLKNNLSDLGAVIDDSYISDEDAMELFSKKGVFILPYLNISQSGVFYAMIQNGCIPVCSDVGDFGHSLREFGLDRLLFSTDAPREIFDCLQWIENNKDELVARLNRFHNYLALGSGLRNILEEI